MLASRPNCEPVAIGISNQRESVVGWERSTGRPIGPVVIWQCRRTASLCEELRGRGLGSLLHERTGLTIDPLFSATKIRWLLDNLDSGQERAEAGEFCFGTMDSWVAWHLAGGRLHTTDLSNASRTQLLGLQAADWDTELLEIFGVPRARPSSRRRVAAGERPWPWGVARRRSHRQPDRRLPRRTLRSGRLPSGFDQGDLRYRIVADDPHAPAGPFEAGPVVNDCLGGRPGRHLRSRGQHPGHRLGRPVVGGASRIGGPGAGRGQAGPWRRGPRRRVSRSRFRRSGRAPFGRRGAGDGQRAHAGRHGGPPGPRHPLLDRPPGPRCVRPDAGQSGSRARRPACRRRRHEKRPADAAAGRPAGRPVLRTTSTEVSALGAAHLAGLAVGLWSSEDELASLPRERDRFEPRMPMAERERRHAGWQEAVARPDGGRRGRLETPPSDSCTAVVRLQGRDDPTDRVPGTPGAVLRSSTQ